MKGRLAEGIWICRRQRIDWNFNIETVSAGLTDSWKVIRGKKVADRLAENSIVSLKATILDVLLSANNKPTKINQAASTKTT